MESLTDTRRDGEIRVQKRVKISRTVADGGYGRMQNVGRGGILCRKQLTRVGRGLD